MNTLALIWVIIIASGVLIYVVLDGFNLGMGILFPFVKSPQHRHLMLATVMPVWDGNETWLIFCSATLYGAFPVVFATILPFLYLPLLLMVIALLLRGVVFEFYSKKSASAKLWDWIFFVGSFFATFFQGMILGTLVAGFDLNQFNHYAWISFFSFATGIMLMFGYALLGATWLMRRTVGKLKVQMQSIAKTALFLTGISMLIVSIWTPKLNLLIHIRWYDSSFSPFLFALPLLATPTFFIIWRCIERGRESAPFYFSILLFTFCYIGLIISIWPYLVPFSIPYWEAAAPSTSLKFMLFGAAIILPLLLIYTWHAYYVFRGKVEKQLEY